MELNYSHFTVRIIYENDSAYSNCTKTLHTIVRGNKRETEMNFPGPETGTFYADSIESELNRINYAYAQSPK